MTTATARAQTARKAAPQKVDLSKLNNRQINALPEDVFIASLGTWGRQFLKAAEPFRGKLKAVK